MANISRVRVTWEGPAITGPAVSTFYSTDLAPVVGGLLSFFDAIKAYVASGVQITIPGVGDLLDSGSGRIVGAWSGSGGGVVTTTGPASFAKGTGFRVVWDTAAVFGGRRVRGSTFIVPATSGAFSTAGNLTTTAQGIALTAATNLLASPFGASMVIQHRPRGFTGGNVAAITGARVPLSPTQLRSRRV